MLDLDVQIKKANIQILSNDEIKYKNIRTNTILNEEACMI